MAITAARAVRPYSHRTFTKRNGAVWWPPPTPLRPS